MSRWIDADALIDNLKSDVAYKDYEWSMYADGFIETIDEAPYIDIVRCKECRHWNEEDHWCNIRDSYGWDYKPDDFCSYGERRDDD